MQGFMEVLKIQRWDDHRYYHHSLVNQSLHFLSATTFLSAYLVLYWSPAWAAIIAWMIAMTSRQCGHFFFEPKGYDAVNQATHEYKEEIKVGYNLRRKVVLMAIWALSPVALYFEPSLFGLLKPRSVPGLAGFMRQVGQAWLAIGFGGLIFRTVQLFFLRDVQTGLVWFTKIITDPLNDIKLYHGAPIELLRHWLDRDDDGLDEDVALEGRG
jgi:hypothetical protein